MRRAFCFSPCLQLSGVGSLSSRPVRHPGALGFFFSGRSMHLPKQRTVAIMAFRRDIDNAEACALMAQLQPVPIPRVVHYQVTIDPARLSPSGEYLRFGMWSDGQGQGDEITGWIGVNELEIIEILAQADSEGVLRPVVHQAAQAA